MPLIADKFGKASKSTEYASATTVKTARLPGVGVLEAFDLSKFATDTPVFFITYKKTIDPVTNVVTIVSQVSWKALVNDVNNTLTNMTVAPGNTDLGNDVGDFIECIPTSYWETSLIDGLLTSINPDGTLKTSAVQAALNISGATPADYTILASAPTAVYLGQRQYQLTYSNVDYTDRLQPKTRLRTVRAVTAPITSSLHNGVNQYWSNATPTKLAFTNNFVITAVVKANGYGSGLSVIASRYNGTSGFRLILESSSGKVFLVGHNAGSANFTQVGTLGSLPLGRKVRITAQLDMTVTTNTPTTSYIMFDDVDMPSIVNRAGTNPTALVQAGNLEIGSENGGTNVFNGAIMQVGIFGAKIAQATMLTYASQSLLGTEPNLLVGYSFGGNANDLNVTTPHNLTSNGGVTALNPDAPWGVQGNDTVSSTVDYGIVMRVTRPSLDTIVIVSVPEGCTIPTLGGVSSTSYSNAANPFGFPGEKARWKLLAVNFTQGTTSPGANVWSNVSSFALVVPIGAWVLTYASTVQATISANNDLFATLSTSATLETDKLLTAASLVQGSGQTSSGSPMTRTRDVKLAAPTTFYHLIKSLAGGTLYFRAENAGAIILAENSML